ncbi:MAG: hypothetical protein U0Q18_05625 [Bryobacteraceae bacterium]
MVFHDKYELLALRGGNQEIALPGREILTAKPVLVHLLASGYTPENQALLKSLAELPAEERSRVLDSGDHDGIPYVVTETLPGHASLRSWAGAVNKPAKVVTPAVDPPNVVEQAADPGEFTRLFKVMKPKPAAEDEEGAAAERPAVQPARDQSETETMEIPAALAGKPGQSAPAGPSIPETPAAAESPKPVMAEPLEGEFTKLMRGKGELAAPPVSSNTALKGGPASSVEKPAPETGATEAAEGEFTRLLRATAKPEVAQSKPEPPKREPTRPAAPVSTDAAIKPAPPSGAAAAKPDVGPAQSAEGEFTRLLRVTAKPEPVESKAEPPKAQPVQPSEGEFTRLMKAKAEPVPAAPTPPVAAVPADTAAKATPSSPTAIRKPDAAPAEATEGEFTRLLRVTAKPEPPAAKVQPPQAETVRPTEPPSREPEAGEFTQLLRSTAPPPRAPSTASAESVPAPPEMQERTQVFRAKVQPQAPPAAPPAQTPAASAEAGEFTRLLQTPVPPATPSPGARAQAPSPATAASQPAAGGPGEFTRLFQPQGTPPKTPAPQEESTRLFQATPSRPAQPAGEGEFTRAMRSPLASPGQPGAVPPSPPPQSKGEFTRILEGSNLPKAPVLPKPVQQPSTGGSSVVEGEFTRMFGSASESSITPASSDQPLPQGGAATGAFSRRNFSPASNAPQGESEFTRIIGTPSPQQPAASPPPAAAAPAPKAPAAKTSYTPLILVLAGLFVLVIILIVVVMLMR